MVSSEWPVTILCPVLGSLLGLAMWFSPLSVMLKQRREHSLNLDESNPLVYGITFVNGLAWLIYALMARDPYLFIYGVSGSVLGLFFCVSALEILSSGASSASSPREARVRLLLEAALFGGLLFWGFVCACLSMGLSDSAEDRATAIKVVGIIGDATTMAYYGSPLTTMLTVVRTGDASTLYVPTIMCNLANALLWFFYGLLGLDAIVVWICSAVGLVLGAVQLLLIAYYYRSTNEAKARRKEAEGRGSPTAMPPIKDFSKEGLTIGVPRTAPDSENSSIVVIRADDNNGRL
jgi:solute carrier family 50 protein (sugar transporter)